MLRVLVSGLALSVLASDALAQSGGAVRELDELVVTARKREERLQDIPAAGSAITAERLEEAGGLRDQRSLTAMLPGVTLVDNDNVNSEFAIRGAGQAGRNVNADAAIALLRNGAQVTGGNIGGRGFARMDFFDIQRIEVLRGAQGALYGANAVGGVISIVSQRPKPAFEALVQGGYSFTREGIDGLAVVNAPLSETLALRAGVDVTEQWGGRVYNTFLRKEIDYQKYQAARLSLGWRPSETFEAIATLDVSRLDDPSGAQIDVSRRKYLLIPETFDYQSRVEANTESRLKQDIVNAGLQLEADFGWAQFTGVSNFRARESHATSDDDGRFPGAPNLANGAAFIAGTAQCRQNNCFSTFTDDAEVFYQEVRLSGDLGGLTYQVGVDFRTLDDTYVTGSYGRVGTTAAAIPVRPAFTKVVSDNKTYGAFATGAYDLSPTLRIEAAARWAEDDKDFEAGLSNDAPAVGSVPARSRTFVNWTYGASLSWRPDTATNLYARIATGFRAGGFNRDFGTSVNLPGNPATPVAYEEEESTAYELGAKFQFSRAANLSLSAFHTDYEGVLVTDTGARAAAQGGGQFFYLANLGDAWSRGLEAELNGVLPDLGGGGGRLSYTLAAVYVQSKISSPITPVDGRRLNGTPKLATTVNGTYVHPLSERLDAFLNVTFQGEDGGFYNITNVIERETNRSLQLRAGVQSRAGWEAALVVTNVLDERYAFFYSGANILAETPGPEYKIQFRYRM